MPPSIEQHSAGTLLWVTSEPAESRQLVVAVASEFSLAVRFCTPDALSGLLDTQRWELLGIELDRQPGESLALLRDVHKRTPELPIFAAAADTSVAMIRAALGAGARDFLSLPLDPQEVHKALIKLTQTSIRIGLEREIIGEVITVYGVRGGLGATTIAVNLAVRLSSLTESKVALVDLDLQRGDVAAFLNLTPLQSLEAIAAARGNVDEVLLLGALTRHPSGIFVLPAPAQIAEADSIGDRDVEVALRLLRSQFRYVVVDTPRAITDATVVAFEQADQVLVLTDLSVPGVRAARRIFELLTRITAPTQRVELVVTNGTRGPVKLEDAVRTIGKEPLLTIPRDHAVASQFMNAGAPLNGVRDSGLATSITGLAARVAGVHGRPESGGHLLRRLFGRSKRVRT